MGKLFGTDGARGVANTELGSELAMQIGRAAAMVLAEGTAQHPRVLIGRDTRLSGDMLEAALTAGFCSVGAHVVSAGVVPTPAVAYLVGRYGFDAGVMISASHNPAEYNGIKLFSGNGYKLPDAMEDRIEEIVFGGTESPALTSARPTGAALGRVVPQEGMTEDYINHIMSTCDQPLDGLRIALDCANGSASRTAKSLFTALGAEVSVLSDRPDGLNINDGCGSTHMEQIMDYVKQGGFDCGFAFDGDADRCLAVDESGSLVDGDRLIAVCASDLQARGMLRGGKAVVTVMSNLGFFRFAQAHGVEAVATRVGDRYVLEEMCRENLSIGGEQSGHIIFLDHATTGDGQLTAVQTLCAMKRSGKSLSELAAVMEVYPQVLVNVEVDNAKKPLLEGNAQVAEAVRAAEAVLGQEGRVLLRASGTEPLVRVMLEGKNQAQIESLAGKIAQAVAAQLDGTVKR